MSRKILVTIMVIAAIFCAYRAGIRHAITESTVSVYLDGIVEIMLDGNIYQHTAF